MPSRKLLMPVSDSAIDDAIDLTSGVPGLEMDADDLAEDVVMMAVGKCAEGLREADIATRLRTLELL